MTKIYFGKQTRQAIRNFPFSKNPAPLELIYALSEIKKAAAIAHAEINQLDEDRKKAIVATCDEITGGLYDDQFATPGLQGGAGTSINMNVNEVIACRANDILKIQGIQKSVHPNDHVNKSQSTNDINPSALKIAAIRLTRKMLRCIDVVASSLSRKATEFSSIKKLGRTHLQDAVPTTLGEEFRSYETIISRDKKRIEGALLFFYDLPLGGTAIGNSINATPGYIKAVYRHLKKITRLDLKPADNFMSQISSQTDFCHLSQSLLILLIDLSKIASDIRLLSSGPQGGLAEITLKELQPGSSIMPGKVNPILAESINQLYFLVSGHNLTIEHAAHAAQLELGVMFPILSDRLILSLKLSCEVIENFSKNCIDTIKANPKTCQMYLEKSTAYATLLTPFLGYDLVSTIVKESQSSGKTLRQIIISKKLMTGEIFDKATELKK